MIAGWQKMSLIDYPGRIACVVFTQGCNLSCFYCHNGSLIPRGRGSIAQAMVLDFLDSHRSLLDALVVSGGEPTLHRNLASFLYEVKAREISVKLDTNGTRPDCLSELLSLSLVDYVAMDYKGSMDTYGNLTGSANAIQHVKATFSLLQGSSIPWEVRTTVAPTITIDDLCKIAAEVEASPLWRIQFYKRPMQPWVPEDPRLDAKTLSKVDVQPLLPKLSMFHDHIVLV